MEQVMEKIKMQSYSGENASVLDVLYDAYVNTNPADRSRLDRYYGQVKQYIKDLPFNQRDHINCIMNDLCVEQEEIAFLDGVRTGARLMLELTKP